MRRAFGPGHGPVITWALLVLLTMASFAATTAGDNIPARLAGQGAILIAMAKAWLIGMRYMELAEAIPLLRWAFAAWIVIVGVTLLTLFALT